MSKGARSRHSSRRDRKPVKHVVEPLVDHRKMMKVAGVIAVVVLAAVPFWMGKSIEFGYFSGIDDTGSYVYSAAHILDGAEIGVEEKPSAQLGTLLVNMLGVRLFGFSEAGPLVIQTVLQVVALVLMFIAIRKLYGGLAAGVGVVVASVYLSFPHMT